MLKERFGFCSEGTAVLSIGSKSMIGWKFNVQCGPSFLTEIYFVFGKAVNWASGSTCLSLLDRLKYNVLFSACISYADGPETVSVHNKYNYFIKTE